MTEDEAKKNWCPMTRVGHVAGMAINRHPDEKDFYEETRCVASKCMMWREHTLDEKTRFDGPRGGFCGLAGKL